MAQEAPKEDIIPGHSSIDDFTKHGFKVLVEATKSSNALPSDRDWDYYKVYESFNKIMQCENNKIVQMMNNILRTQQLNVNVLNKDLEEKTEIVIEANDDILEKVALGIDEMNGIKRTNQQAIEIQTVSAQLPVNGSWNQLNKATFSVNSSLDTSATPKSDTLQSITLLTAKNIVRPQMFFKDKIDNSNNHPWIPRITDKPNSIKPLAIFLEESENGEIYSHPYELELDHFQPPVDQLQKVVPKLPKPLEETPLVEISTPEQLNELLEELRKHKEFAVDLEHHSYRTFMGITCLLQISTTDCDYLVDTFTLRDKLCILNEVFTKPSIVKVFHGADSDIEWLQRDLSLYVVNMFDTHQAAKQLQYSGLSLAYLMNRFCNVVPNKHFQLADWRIRPLPNELKLYARMDTHYLLYVYHVLKNELIDRGNGSDNILRSVIQQSTQICKKCYIKPVLHEESHLDFYRKCKRLFDNRQMYALKELFHWRDNLARIEDESTGYILPNHMLLQIAETLPREMQGILACCNPIPPLVRANLLELHRIILRAREQSVVKSILKEDTRSRGSTLQFTKINIDSPLYCPHDLTKQMEFRDDLPTLLKFSDGECVGNANVTNINKVINIEKTKSIYSVFNTPENTDGEDENETVLQKHNITFLDPYERYKLVKPFVQAEEDKAAMERAAKAEKESTEKSTDERIAALHQHFVHVCKETPQKMPTKTEEENLKNVAPKQNLSNQQIPTAMGGSKKRKNKQKPNRDHFKNCNQFTSVTSEVINSQKPVQDFGPQLKRIRNEPQSSTSIQNVQGKKQRAKLKKNKKKAKPEFPPQANEKIDLQNSTQNQNQNFFNNPKNQPQPYFPKQNSQAKKQKRNKKAAKVGNQDNALKDNQDARQIPNTVNTNNEMSSKKRKRLEWNRRKRQNQKSTAPQVTSIQQIPGDIFTPFDYSTVNFQAFQGGSASSNTNKNKAVKSKFKAKNKRGKFNRNSNNKSITYDRPNK